MHRTVDWLDWITIVAYAMILCGIALYHSRKMKSQDDILLAGRSMSRWPIALSMYMALFSTNTFVGVTGWLNKPNGTVWIGLQNIGMVTAVPLVIWLYPSFFFRLRISTAYEYLERRFNYAVRLFAALFFLGARILWMATMLYSSGLVVSRMLGWTPDQGAVGGQVGAMLIIAALGTFFALAGGMHAVIWTDVVQFFVMMGGVVTMVVFATCQSGGPAHVLSTAVQAGKFQPPQVFSLTDELSICSGLMLGFIAMLSSAGSDQMVLQTYLTARSESEAKRSLRRNGYLLKPLSLIFPCLGLIMFVYYQTHPQVAGLMRRSDDALPVFVLNVLPSGMRGLMIVAIVSAVLTSLESGMAATSACVQVDFIQRWRSRPLSNRAAVVLGRSLIFLWGVAIFSAALWVERLGEKNNVIQILNIVMYPFSGVLLGIFLLGMLTRRANSAGALIGAIAGFVVTVGVPLLNTIVKAASAAGMSIPHGFAEGLSSLAGISNFYYGALGTAATALLGYTSSLLFDAPPLPKVLGLTHRNPPPPSVATVDAAGDR
jgi:solute:Na+ symporter, SSS family